MSHAGGLTLEWFIGQLADALLDRMAARDEGLVDQRDRRGLMGRRHIDAVKRRMADERAAGVTAPTAFQRGRDYLLTPEAARQELARVSAPGLVSQAPPERSVRRGGPRKSERKRSDRDEAAAVRRELDSALRREG